MTDDLSKYESIVTSLRLRGEPEGAKALDELVAMVREARQELLDASYAGGNEILEQFERANAAERELAELKRRMREPDDDLVFAAMMVFFRVSRRNEIATAHFPMMRAAWLAGVKHLLGEKE